MLKFKIVLPDKTETEVNVDNTYSIQQLIDYIKDLNQNKKWSTYQLELYFIDQFLQPDASINKIIYIPQNDYLTLKIKKGEKFKKLKTFFTSVSEKVTLKTQSDIEKLKNAIHRSQTLKEQEQPKKSKQIFNKFVSFLLTVPNKVSEITKQKTQNFVDKINLVTQTQDPSHIQQQDDQQKNNNDTVIGLLDDMITENEQKIVIKKQNQSKINPKSLSPEVEEYLYRKKKAFENLNNPSQILKAKQLISDLSKQRKELEEKRLQKLKNQEKQLDQSIEKYKIEKVQQQENLIEDKRKKIQDRLIESSKNHLLQQQLILQQKQLINEIKQKEKEKQKKLLEREKSIQKQYFDDAKAKLQQRKLQAAPIRLDEIQKHEEDYIHQRQLLKLEKEQKKLEREISIQQSTKQVYKSKQFLNKVIEQDNNQKSKDVFIKQKQAEKNLRKQKYSEIVKEYYKPLIKAQTDIQFSKILNNKSDQSIQEEFVDFLQEKDIKPNQNKFDSIRTKLNQQIDEKQQKLTNKIQSALNLQKVNATKVTEFLKQGKVPDSSVYFQPKIIDKIIINETAKNKPKDYLKELEQKRENQQGILNSQSEPKLKKYDQKSDLERIRRHDREVERKKHLAYYLDDDKLKDEADELFLKNIEEKINFLKQQ